MPTNSLLYVASSWRNPHYDGVIATLRNVGIPHYDFKHPTPGNQGFHWREIDPHWQSWDARSYRQALRHPLAEQGFAYDMQALQACSHLLFVLPAGRSASLELGHAIGAGKFTIVYYPETEHLEPELMFKAATVLCVTMAEVLTHLASLTKPARSPLCQTT